MTTYRKTMREALEEMHDSLDEGKEKLPRQLVDPNKEVMVVKKNKVIVIDKKDQDKYMKQGYSLAEDVELDEGYERTVLLALSRDNIGGYFSNDVLYVAQRKIEDAKAAIKADSNIKVVPKIMGEEVDLDEGTKQVLAHGGKGQYKAVSDGGVVNIMYKGKVISSGDFDRGADGWFLNIKGEKGQKFFDDAQKMVDYFAKNKITEEVELDEFTVSDVEIAMKKKYGKVDKEAIEKLKKVQHMGNVDRNALVKVGHGKLHVESVELDEAKYDLYHKDFSTAMQHAYAMAKKLHGITVDPKEIDDKVASGPSKPSEGKTNSYRLKGDKGAIQVQVYNKGGSKPFELNFYKEEVSLISAVEEQLAKIKGNTPGDQGRRGAVEDDLDEGTWALPKTPKEKAALKKLLSKPLKAKDASDKLYDIIGDDELADDVDDFADNNPNDDVRPIVKGHMKRLGIKEDTGLDEAVKVGDTVKVKLNRKGKEYIEKGKVTKIEKDSIIVKHDFSHTPSKVSMKNIVKEEVAEGAAADARRAMRDDPDMKQRAFSKDVSSTDDDEKAASKNIMMQLRKAVSLRSYDVEFADGKKQKVNQKIAQAVQNKYNSMRRPADKEKFQSQIAKSYKDMLQSLKAGYGEQKESILEKIDRKIKENKNG